MGWERTVGNNFFEMEEKTKTKSLARIFFAVHVSEIICTLSYDNFCFATFSEFVVHFGGCSRT